MLAMVLGGAASGKSAYAEQLTMSLSAERFYIATMQTEDAESDKRIARHRKMRAGKGFITVERQLNLAGLVISHKGGAALLECASTLVGNELSMPGGAAADTAAAVYDGVENLLRQGLNLVVVSNNVFGAGGTYTPEMSAYLRQLGLLNRLIASRADLLVEVVCGLPIYHKGSRVL